MRRRGGRREGRDVEPHRDISFSCQHRAREPTNERRKEGRKEGRKERLLTLLRYIAADGRRADDGHRNYQRRRGGRPPREREGNGVRPFVFRSLNRLRFLSGRRGGQGTQNNSVATKAKRRNDRPIDRSTEKSEKVNEDHRQTREAILGGKTTRMRRRRRQSVGHLFSFSSLAVLPMVTFWLPSPPILV